MQQEALAEKPQTSTAKDVHTTVHPYKTTQPHTAQPQVPPCIACSVRRAVAQAVHMASISMHRCMQPDHSQHLRHASHTLNYWDTHGVCTCTCLCKRSHRCCVSQTATAARDKMYPRHTQHSPTTQTVSLLPARLHKQHAHSSNCSTLRLLSQTHHSSYAVKQTHSHVNQAAYSQRCQ
jgi:hypothetical protein